MIGFFEFHKAHSEILLTACTDQVLYNLSLTKLCLAYPIQNTEVFMYLFIYLSILYLILTNCNYYYKR